MTKENLRFYNMIIHLIQNNKLYEENAAIKKVWQKEGTTFFVIYFYRTRKSYVFDSAFIHDLLDLSNERYYKSPAAFVVDYGREETLEPPSEPEDGQLIDKKLFEPLEADLILMTFMANICDSFSPIKETIIYDYIIEKIPATENLSQQYVNAYLQGIKPAREDFYKALEAVSAKNPDEAEEMVKEIVKICLADGQLHYNEKLYLAEIFQTLREQGVEPEVGL